MTSVAAVMGFASGSKQASPTTGVSAALLGLNGARITWTNPDPSLYDYVTIDRNINSGGYSQIVQPSKGVTTYDDAPGYSLDAVYRVTAHRTGMQDALPVVTSNVRTQPNTPSPQNLTTTNPGVITFTANSPGHGNITGFDVRLSTDNGASYAGVVDTGADPSHVFSGVGHGLVCRVQTRTRDGFGQVSAFVEWVNPVTCINDVTGPNVIPTPTVGAWSDGFGGHLVSWGGQSDSQSAIGSTYMQYQIDGGGWNTMSGVGLSPGAGGSQYLGVGSANRGHLVSFRLLCYDIYGNSNVGGGSTQVYTKPLGSFNVAPISSHTYGSSSGWRSVGPNGDQLIGDVQSAQSNYGCWFYNAAIQNVCKGYAPDAATILMQKVAGLSSPGIVYLDAHGHDTQPGGAPSLAGINDGSNSLPGTGYLTATLPAVMRSGFGTGAYRGVNLTTVSQPFKAVYGVSEDGFSGIIALTFN